MKSLTNTDIECLKNLLSNGKSVMEISIELKVPIGTVHKYKKLFNLDNENIHFGRPHLLSDTHKRLIKRLLLAGKLKTGVEVHKYLLNNGYKISYTSCTRLLKGLELKARIKKKETILKKAS